MKIVNFQVNGLITYCVPGLHGVFKTRLLLRLPSQRGRKFTDHTPLSDLSNLRANGLETENIQETPSAPVKYLPDAALFQVFVKRQKDPSPSGVVI